MNDNEKTIQDTNIKQAIDNIELTPEQEDKIYQSIENHTPIKHNIRFTKILTPIAACLAVLIVTGTILVNLNNSKMAENATDALSDTEVTLGLSETLDSELVWKSEAYDAIEGKEENGDVPTDAEGYMSPDASPAEDLGGLGDDYDWDLPKSEGDSAYDSAVDGGISCGIGEATNGYVDPQAGLLRGASINDHEDSEHFLEYVNEMSNGQSPSFWKLFPDYSGDYSYKSETPKTSLDLMFMIDTTGSMGDELSYLQAELSDIIRRVKRDNAQIPINLSCNFYRDNGDEYIVKNFPFSSNIEEGLKNLNAQNADGGGDTPEAVELALEEALKHDWRSDDNVAKLLFLVLDAPPHSEDKKKDILTDCVERAREMGIVILPVAASGIDSDTEFLLRQIAYYTGGTYQFLVDNYYGIGGEHTTPTDKAYEEKNFNDLLVEIINSYLA